MGNRNKEDERIERAIRSLMKLPDNRRCINCNNLGPQYVCTTFATFVCMNCSGIHREFTHRVKSVSVANFTAEEVTALQTGGNERARQVFFRYWDLQRHSYPDSSNLNKLRDFIKHVYVDKKYAGDRSSTGPPRLPSKNKVDPNRGSRGSYEEEKYEKCFAGRFGKNEDLPGKSQQNHSKNPPLSSVYPWSGSQRRNPVRFEVVDDRVRDEIFGNRRFMHGDTMLGKILPKSNTNSEKSGIPVVRPLEEILGGKFPALRVSEISKESNKKNATDRSACNKDSETVKPNPVEKKVEPTQSLIDLDDVVAEPSNVVLESQTSSSKDSRAPPKVRTLESLLFDLSIPSEDTNVDVSGVPGGDALPVPTQKIPDLIDGVEDEPIQPSNDDLIQDSGTGVKASDEWLFENLQPSTSIGDQNNELGFASLGNNEVGSSSVVPEETSQLALALVQDSIAGAESQILPQETKSSCRMELPLDLFTANYPSSMAAPISGWQTVPPQGMGFNYYPNTVPVQAYPNQAKSTNPFDISDDRSQFSSMTSLHGSYQSQFPSPQANAYLMHQQPLYNVSTFSPGSYMGQDVHNDIQPVRSQGFGGPVSDGSVLVSMNTTQHPPAIYTNHANPNSSMGGNPFG